MKRFLRSPISVFALAFFLSLISGAILLAAVRGISRQQGLLLVLVLAGSQAGLWLHLVHQLHFRFRREAQVLPPSLCATLTDASLAEQFRRVCQAYEKKADEFNTFAAERFLSNLLSDNSHTHAMENLKETVNSVLRSDIFGYRWTYYCLVYIKLEDYGSYTLKNCNGHLLFDDFRRMYDAVRHSFSVVLDSRHIAHSLERKEACVFLVNLANTQEDTSADELNAAIDRLCERCAAAIQQVADTFNVTLEVAVSIPYSDTTQTYTNFEWLVTMKEYCDFVYGPRPVLGPRDLDRLIVPDSKGSALLEKKYYSALLSENHAEAEQALLELNHSFLSGDAPDISYLKTITTIRLTSAETIVNSGKPAQGSDPLDWRASIQSVQTLEQLNAQIHTFFLHLEERAHKQSQERAGTAQKIVAFLDKNYFFPDISMTVLSESLSLSPSYISRIFKRETGQNIPDYIHSLRIAKAKSLLSTTDHTIGEIAEQVGYTTAWTMNRAFKRYENMTPGTYRQLSQSSKE